MTKQEKRKIDKINKTAEKYKNAVKFIKEICNLYSKEHNLFNSEKENQKKLLRALKIAFKHEQ